MKKVVIAIIAVLLVIGVAGFIVLRPGSVSKGLIYPDGPDVQVNTGSGWLPATDEMELRVGSAIKTGADTATVVLLEGEIVQLQANSQITLEQITSKAIKISVQAGETLNKVTKLSGIKSYTVESPSTVATVRGTTFFYSDNEVTVEDGEVTYGPSSNPNQVGVKAGKKSNKNGFSVIDLDEKDRAKFERFREKQINALKRVRDREMKKHQTALKIADAQGYNEGKRQELIKQVDEDPAPSEDKAYGQVPLPLKGTAERTYRLTKEIKKVRAARQNNAGGNAGTQTGTPSAGTLAQDTCKSPNGCRTYDAECGGRGSERLFVDGTYQRCVDATKAAVEGIQYCGRTPLAQGDRACNYMTNDPREKSSCICPSHQ